MKKLNVSPEKIESKNDSINHVVSNNENLTQHEKNKFIDSIDPELINNKKMFIDFLNIESNLIVNKFIDSKCSYYIDMNIKNCTALNSKNVSEKIDFRIIAINTKINCTLNDYLNDQFFTLIFNKNVKYFSKFISSRFFEKSNNEKTNKLIDKKIKTLQNALIKNDLNDSHKKLIALMPCTLYACTNHDRLNVSQNSLIKKLTQNIIQSKKQLKKQLLDKTKNS